MPQATMLKVTLSEEAREFIQKRVASGEFASESDVISDALEHQQALHDDQERWEREVLIPTHDELMANLSSAIPLDQVERNLEQRRQQRRKAS